MSVASSTICTSQVWSPMTCVQGWFTHCGNQSKQTDRKLATSLSSYQQPPLGNMIHFPPQGYHYGPGATGSYEQVASNYSHGYPQPNGSHMLQSLSNGPLSLVGQRDMRNPFSGVHDTTSIKVESPQYRPQTSFYNTDLTHDDHSTTRESSKSETAFTTDVDTLMKAIQAKTRCECQRKAASDQSPLQPCGAGCVRTATTDSQPRRQDAPAVSLISSSPLKLTPKKKFQCSIPECGKNFGQKTHLEIHMRAHTGIKPFVCKEPSCGQRFSQLGNLKTHERRHTGERPFQCELCGKRFAQRGNVRAHRSVHQHKKPFLCKLDGCGKHFTQLGNLKSHQNKFHANSLRKLTQKFATFHEGDLVSTAERELWEYFATLYKNSNKGIKGRGKDRKIAGINATGLRTDHHTETQSSASPTNSYSSHVQQNAQMYNSDGLDTLQSSPVEPSYPPHLRLPPHPGHSTAHPIYSYDGRRDF